MSSEIVERATDVEYIHEVKEQLWTDHAAIGCKVARKKRRVNGESSDEGQSKEETLNFKIVGRIKTRVSLLGLRAQQASWGARPSARCSRDSGCTTFSGISFHLTPLHQPQPLSVGFSPFRSNPASPLPIEPLFNTDRGRVACPSVGRTLPLSHTFGLECCVCANGTG